MSDLYKLIQAKKEKSSEKIVSTKKELGSRRAEEATKLIGKVKYVQPRRSIVVDLDKSQRKLPSEDTSSSALNILY